MSPLAIPRIDSLACEQEPIRFPGAVQPHGALLVLDTEAGIIEAASASCATLLGHGAEQLLGQTVAQCFGPDVQTALFSDPGPSNDAILSLRLSGRAFSVQTHRNASGHLLVDIEAGDPHATAVLDWVRTCRRDIQALRRLGPLDEITQAAAQLVRAFSGFDRVMIYRFDPSWNGEVVAEALADGLDPYLGLHYPASDIPRQARELFQASKVRHIPDVAYTPSVLLARGHHPAIDLGGSCLRSVSPLHIEYLMNMQVRATLVGSLVVEGRLWGLVSCQNLTQPRFIGPSERAILGWLCEDLAELIQERQLREGRDREVDLALRRRRLIDRLRDHDFSHLMRNGESGDLLGVVGADGFALVIDATVQTTGHTPSPARILELRQRQAARAPKSPVFATSALNHDLQAPEVGDGVSGALFVTVPHKPAITMIWFRDERSQHIRWGGDPSQAHSATADGRISPRKSFAQFLQDIRGQSLAWTPQEQDSATELGSMIEIESLREREAFARTILNSMPEHIVVLDRRGDIVAVNSAWSQFAHDNDATGLAAASLGWNYGDICTAAQGSPEGEVGAAAWSGIQAVLLGRKPSFEMEYECNTPTQPHWFRMSVSRMQAPADGAVVAHEDITQRKLAEQALRRESDKIRSLLRHASDGIHILDPQGRVLDASDSFCRMLGYSLDEVMALNVADWDAKFGPLQGATGFEKHFAKGGRVEFETLHRRRDGSLIEVEISGIGLWREGSRAMFYSSRDITARKQAQRALAANEARLRTLFASMAEGLVLQASDGSIVDANPAAELMLGLSRDELLGSTRSESLWRAVREDGSAFPEAEQPAMVTLRTGRPVRAVVMGIRRKGRGGVRWLSVNAQPMAAADTVRPEAVLTTFSDISELRKATLRLNKAKTRLEGLTARQARHLQTLAKELTQAEQAERDRLHDLLHGGVQPLLVAARLSLSALGSRAPLAQMHSVVAESCDQIAQALDATRTLSLQLTPPLALELGIGPALDSLCHWVKKNHDHAVRLETHPDAQIRDREVRLACFNAVRELLTNVVKYAGVNQSTVTTRAVDAGTFSVVVRDAGVGLGPAWRAQGSGLAGIERRLLMFGGTMRVESQPGHGTTIHLQMPSQELATKR